METIFILVILQKVKSTLECKRHTVKKKVRKFPVPSRDVSTKLSLGGNNDVITELFLPRGRRRETREPFFTVQRKGSRGLANIWKIEKKLPKVHWLHWLAVLFVT